MSRSAPSPRFPATRIYEIGEPLPARTKLHPLGCRCGDCEPDAPLTAGAIGKHGLAGFAIGIGVAVALNPAHAVASLLAIIGMGI